ncbi:hypothetical protein Cpin_6253 [Chitinophaga pinensis DSM 2588]|uniref:Uncharacterized protein n=1 Tax=Chitinophaga pinensis (strain ATCC 43595 / DSM 2588 / LMG 13176 / NBRC 15968 / NCIMB 11800 / UQM 2034) TaxID=485918 RepID=A0A979GAC8_CHIPD|nr:hypothetical protein Cpin_6253 [Chitinophaga pinensis DSM 2588]
MQRLAIVVAQGSVYKEVLMLRRYASKMIRNQLFRLKSGISGRKWIINKEGIPIGKRGCKRTLGGVKRSVMQERVRCRPADKRCYNVEFWYFGVIRQKTGTIYKPLAY